MKRYNMKSNHNIINRYTAVLLSILIMFSAIGGALSSIFGVSAAEVSATDSHVVYSNDFSNAETMSDWRWAAVDNASYSQYTASIADGKFTFNNANASGSFLHGMRFIPDKKFTEQRAVVTFKAQKGLKPCLWARVNQQWKGNSQSCYGYYLLFNCNQNGSFTLDLAARVGTTSKTIGSVRCGTSIVEGQEYRMEMVCQGTNPTLISVTIYTKVGSNENAVLCHDIFVDGEATLQEPGSAGMAAARTSAVSETNVSIEKFEFTSTDNVTGSYYVEEGTTGSKTFGQVVMLDPTKKYVLSAHAVDNGIRNGEDVNPLWIEYFNTNSTATRLLTSRGSLKSNRVMEDAESAGINYDEYFTVFYEFDMSALTDKKTESGMSNKTRVIVGFRNDASTATAGKFSHFTLYAKDDAKKTNLIINPDFRMGLYGWNEVADSYMNYTQMEESQGTTKNGFATLHSVSDEDYKELFKNNDFLTPIEPEKDYMVKNTGLYSGTKFGQEVELNIGTEYVYSVNAKYVTKNNSKPGIWYESAEGGYKLFNDYITVTESMTEAKITHRFKVSAKDAVENNGKIKFLVGYSSGDSGAEAYYRNFELYEAIDAGKTNIIKNSDFSAGLKYWTATCHEDYAAIEDETVTETVNGCAVLVEYTDGYFLRTELPDGKIVIHNNGQKAYGKVGNIVYLDPDKTYVYGVSYKYIDQKLCKPFILYNNTSGTLTNYDPDSVALSITSDEDYYRSYYEFTIPAESKKEADGRVKMKIGFTTGMAGADAYFGDFLLYEKSDSNKTNLLNNADFNLGFKGWADDGAAVTSQTQYSVYGADLVAVADDFFKRPTVDKLTGNWVIHNTGTVEYSKFGQIVELDPTKTYVYAVSYKYIDQKGSMPYMRYFDGTTYQNFASYISEKQDEEYYRAYYEFKAPAEASVLGNGKVRMQIGITCGMGGADTFFGDFLLYEKGDSKKTNIFVNADFALGLYGWTSNGYNGLPITEYGVMKTVQGDVELKKVADDYFKRPTVDKLTGNWVIHNTGTVEYSKFGQIVELDPTKTYIYAVSYKYIDQKGSMPYMRYFDGTTYQNYNQYISETQDEEYYRAYYEFKVPEGAKVDSNGRVKMQIGITCGMSGADTYFGDFLLHEKGDSKKTNIFVNADFALGLYGWTSNGYNGLPITEYGVTVTKQGDVVLKKVADDYFKRPKFNKLTGNWVIHNTGKVEYAKFGQIVELDPTKTYVYAISYKYIDQKGSMPFMRYFDGTTYQNYAEFISEAQDEKYYRAYYEFKAPKAAAKQANGKVKMQIGITCGMGGADAYFGDFLLYEKGDSKKTNIFVNADFALGLYGWTSNGYNNLPISDYGVKTTIQGDVELKKVADDYFKRPKFNKLTGNWVIHNTGKVEYAKFGQIVELDPTKTYIYSVSYKYIDQKGSMPFMRYFDGAAYQNYTEYISETQDDEYYRACFEFKAPKEAAKQANGKVKMQIGITCGMGGADAYFGDFLLYEKGDSKKTNIFVNADFALGLYGWTSNGYNNLPISDYGVKTTIQGDVELKKVEDDYFKRPYFEKFTEEPMLHITGKWSYAHPGQIVELNPGETYYYAMYEKYFAQNGSKPLVFVKKNGSYEALVKELEIESQDLMNCHTVYKFTLPKDIDIRTNGKSEVLVGFTTGIVGADAYFYDLQLYSSLDSKKTNLFVNPDFELGLFGWTGTSYNYKPETEYGVTTFRYKNEAELMPYDANLFVNDLSDEFYDDGNWAEKYGDDYTMSEWLKKVGVSVKDNPTDAVVNNVDTNTQNYIWIWIAAGSGIAVALLAGVIIFLVKKRRKE